MRFKTCMKAALGFTALVAAASANAVDFSGTITAGGLAGPSPDCAPLPFHGVSNGSGNSGLGGFSYTHDICLSGPNGPLQGTFLLDFGQSTLFGDLTGLATPDVGIPGTADLALTYDILGGTGDFLGATGTFGGTAFSDPRNSPPTLFSLNFTGDVAAPLPEPRTWAMLLFGFGLMGAVLRRGGRNAEASRSKAV